MAKYRKKVFPTCVGMNRIFALMPDSLRRVPHMRGDEPKPANRKTKQSKCSPHAWG